MRLVSSSGAVVEVKLVGSGFSAGDPGANTVYFGSHVMRRVRANDEGTLIILTVPTEMDSGREAPPSQVVVGEYPVRVETTQGISNAVMLRVYR